VDNQKKKVREKISDLTFMENLFSSNVGKRKFKSIDIFY